MKSLNVAIVSDFCFPGIGGVESHIYSIALELKNLGHKETIITHKYTTNNKVYQGKLTYMGFVIYYLNIPTMFNQVTMPLAFGGFFIYKEIYLKHRIDVVHGHQSLSPMCVDAMFHANMLGIKTVLAEHSLAEIGTFETTLSGFLSKWH